MTTFASKAIGSEDSFVEFLEQRKNASDVDMANSTSPVEMFFAGGQQAAKIEMWLRKIPKEEAEAIYLWVFREKRQTEIARMFGVTQAAISYRIKKGRRRLQFLLSIPDIDASEIESELPKFTRNGKQVFDDLDVAILVKLLETTCQSDVSRSLGVSQGKVRARFFKIVETLRGLKDTGSAAQLEKAEKFYEVFHSLVNNFNIFRRVHLPQWDSRDTNEIVG
jgi:DNA-directed RNA polymerase specialized sigma24 family protein